MKSEFEVVELFDEPECYVLLSISVDEERTVPRVGEIGGGIDCSYGLSHSAFMVGDSYEPPVLDSVLPSTARRQGITTSQR